MSLPIRLRLTLAFAMGMALVLLSLGAFLYWRVGQDLLASLDLSLRARAQVIVTAFDQRGSAGIRSSGNLIDSDESFTQLLDGSGRVLDASMPALRVPLLEPGAWRSVSGPAFLVRDVPRIDADPLRFLVVPLGTRSDGQTLVVGATLGDRNDALERLLIALGAGGPVALLLMSVAGWMLAGGALRPVEAMRQEAAAISISEPERRLTVPETRDELARLGSTLNSMLNGLQESFERERRFVGDASHELRTPLGILKMEIDLALARSRTTEELEAALRSASTETDRLVQLAEDLLVLARAEGGRLPLHRTEEPLREVLRRSVATSAKRALSSDVRIELEVDGTTARIDPIRLRQAVENMLDNALGHSRPGQVILVRAGRSGATVTISVEDSGPGFPEHLLERAFEPFARSEANPSGDGSSGSGLGLAIVRAVAEAHGGTAKAENLPQGGARVTISMPG